MLSLIFNWVNYAVAILLEALWWLVSHGGWVAIVAGVIRILLGQYLKEIRSEYLKAQQWVFLQIRIPKTNELSTLAVEQIFAQMHAVSGAYTFTQKYIKGQQPLWYSLEILSLGGKISFLIRAPREYMELVEAAIYAHYPEAEITEVQDYMGNLKYDPSSSSFDIWGTELMLTADSALPIKTYREFEHLAAKEKIIDPLRSLIEGMGKIRSSELAAVQIVALPVNSCDWKSNCERLAKALLEGKTTAKSRFPWIMSRVNSLLSQTPHAPKAERNFSMLPDTEKERVNGILRKAGKPGYRAMLRLLYLASKESFDPCRPELFLGAFRQLSNSNGFVPNPKTDTRVDYKLSFAFGKSYIGNGVKRRKASFMDSLKQRSLGKRPYVLNTEELATIYHLPLISEESPPMTSLGTLAHKTIQPPGNLPVSGSTK